MANLMGIPDELKLKILSYFSFDEITRLRLVSREFNLVCMDALNFGFNQAENFHIVVQKEIRSKLPRRESERREHEYSRHADILSAIETRMSLLQITYAKYIESGYSCFIPGKVLDELLKVLRFVRTAKDPPRSHEVLTELRDISSMAMEHFEEKILPPLKKQLQREGVAVLPGGLTVDIEKDHRCKSAGQGKRSASCSPSCSSLPKRRKMNSLDGECASGGGRRSGATTFSSIFSLSRGELATFAVPDITDASGSASSDYTLTQSPSERGIPLAERVLQCEQIIARQGEIIKEQSRSLAEMNRKIFECNQRFNDLADVLQSQFQSQKIHDKISSLIQPVRDTTAVFAVDGAKREETLLNSVSADSDLPGSSSTTYTRVISRGMRRYGRRNSSKSAEQRAKLLKEDMDLFRDEVKL